MDDTESYDDSIEKGHKIAQYIRACIRKRFAEDDAETTIKPFSANLESSRYAREVHATLYHRHTHILACTDATGMGANVGVVTQWGIGEYPTLTTLWQRIGCAGVNPSRLCCLCRNPLYDI